MNKNSRLNLSFMSAVSAVRQTAAMALVMGTALCAWSPLASAQYGGCTPVVAVTSPVEGQTLTAPGPITLTASAGPCLISTVEFRANGVLVMIVGAPFTYQWTNVAAGNYAITAKATDVFSSTSATSAPVNVTVTNADGSGNAAPTVTMTAPTSGSSMPAPGAVTLIANATDSDGTIQSVQFWSNGVLVATDLYSDAVAGAGNGCAAGCYSTQLSNLPEGSYMFKAVATDNAGASTTSEEVAFIVTESVTVSVARTYVYDEYERLCKTINPESGATVIDYDAAGNIAWTAEGTTLTTSQCNRGSVTEGQKTYRTYDARNRLISVSTPGGTADVTTTYHADGAVASLAAANPGGINVTTTYSYNKRRLLTSETSSNGATLYTLGYGYNANGHLGAITYPDNQVVSYLPDALGRATKVGVTGGTTYASNIGYFPNGAIRTFTYGNGIVHTMTQNTRRLPARSRDAKGFIPALDDSYFFDENGNVDYITDATAANSNNRSRSLGYDQLDRLIVADAPNQWGTATYAYDGVDNLTRADQGARQYRYNYDALTNRLSTITDPAGATQITLGYDAQGNVIGKNAQTMVFDSANRLSEVAGQQVYRYDGQGRRVQTTDSDGKTTFWIYSQSGQVLHTAEARRSQNLSYIYLGNTQVATRTVAWGSGATSTRYQHTDALGSIVAETNASGGIVKRNSYAPYGEAYAPTVIDGTGYTGHVMDQATGLTYMQQRYYDPQIGRFLSNDPVSTDPNTGASFNRYNYANNNPYRFTDPDGRDAADTAYGAAVGLMQGNNPERMRIWAGGEAAATTEGSGAEMGAAMGMAAGEFARNGDYSKEAVAGVAVKAMVMAVTKGKIKEFKPGAKFTPAQKKAILAANRERNGGELKSDKSGGALVPSEKSRSGVTPSPQEAQVDHKIPRAAGGTNDPANAQVLSRKENRDKSDRVE